MVYYDKYKYSKLVINDELIEEIERNNGIKCLFGGVFSAKVHEFDNTESDTDFLIFFDGGNGSENRSFRFVCEQSLEDINMIDYRYLIKQIESREIIDYKVPSILYRNKDIIIHKFNQHRDDFFSSQKIFEILYSNFIWDSGFLIDNLDEILNMINVVDVLDYYYSRAYGNLVNKLEKEYVQCRIILRCFMGYCCMKQIIEDKEIPFMKMDYLIKRFSPKKFLDYLNKVLELEKSSGGDGCIGKHSFDFGEHDLFKVDPDVADKGCLLEEKQYAMIEKNESFNSWMRSELESIAISIYNLSTKDRENIKLGKKCILARELGNYEKN